MTYASPSPYQLSKPQDLFKFVIQLLKRAFLSSVTNYKFEQFDTLFTIQTTKRPFKYEGVNQIRKTWEKMKQNFRKIFGK